MIPKQSRAVCLVTSNDIIRAAGVFQERSPCLHLQLYCEVIGIPWFVNRQIVLPVQGENERGFTESQKFRGGLMIGLFGQGQLKYEC